MTAGQPQRLLLALLVPCACAPQSWAQMPPAASTTAQRAADKAAVIRLERRWVVALAPGGDRSALGDILADQYVDIDWRGQIRHKADLIHATGSPKDAVQHVTALQVRVWGDSAVATGVNTVHSPTRGWTIEVPFTDVFERIDGRWRAVSSQETLRKPPASSAGF
jgi:hypothetical protein